MDGRTDRVTNGRTDRQTDRDSQERKKERKEFIPIYRQTNNYTDSHAIHLCQQTDIQTKSETFMQT